MAVDQGGCAAVYQDPVGDLYTALKIVYSCIQRSSCGDAGVAVMPAADARRGAVYWHWHHSARLEQGIDAIQVSVCMIWQHTDQPGSRDLYRSEVRIGMPDRCVVECPMDNEIISLPQGGAEARHGNVWWVTSEHKRSSRMDSGGAHRPCTAKGEPEKEEIKVSVVIKANTTVDPWAVMIHAQYTRSTYAAMVAESGLGLLAGSAPAFRRWMGI